MSAAGWFIAGVLTAFGTSALAGLVIAAMIQPADTPPTPPAPADLAAARARRPGGAR